MFIFDEMIFSFTFEIGLLVLGLLYIGDLYLDSIINLIEISKDIDEKERVKKEDDDLKLLTKHIYS